MSLSLGYPAWLLITALAAAGGLAFWMYRRTVPAVSRPLRTLLSGLRFLSVGLLLFLLFEPIVRNQIRSEVPPTLAVVVDNSRSLGPYSDGDTTDSDTARTSGSNVHETVRRALDRIEQAPPRLFLFGGTTTPSDGPPEQALDSLDFSEPRTDIAQALEFARSELEQENLSGVLLISDGLYNTGRNPLYVADRYPVPIHTIVTGDTTRQRDVQIRRITTNDIAYAGTELPVQVGVGTEGFGGEQVRVTLSRSGSRLDSRQVALPVGSAEIPVELSFEPQGEGLQQFHVAVTELPGEVTHRNNSATFTVRVLSSRKRVVLFGAAPGPDVAAVRQLLETGGNVNLETFIQRQPGAFYEGTPGDLAEADAIVLAGYPGSAAQASEIQPIVDAAEEDVPLLFLLTRQTDLEALQDHFGDVLPATPEVPRPGFSEAIFVPNAAAQQHPVFNLATADIGLFSRVPPLAYNDSRWAVSPDARVLAVPQISGVELDDPLLLVRQRSGHRSAALLAADTWRWVNLPEDLEEASPLWPSLFSNLLEWVSTPDNDQQVRVQPTRDAFAGGESVQLSGQVYDESLNPVDNASLEVHVTTPEGDEYPYTMESVGNGRYLLDIGSLPEGTYTYTARASDEGGEIGQDNGTFAVGGLTLEFRETRADAGLMRQLAHRSGGSFFFPDSLDGLSGRLARTGAFEPTYLDEVQEMQLWHRYSLLGVIIMLLSAEWFFRKRNGMI